MNPFPFLLNLSDLADELQAIASVMHSDSKSEWEVLGEDLSQPTHQLSEIGQAPGTDGNPETL